MMKGRLNTRAANEDEMTPQEYIVDGVRRWESVAHGALRSSLNRLKLARERLGITRFRSEYDRMAEISALRYWRTELRAIREALVSLYSRSVNDRTRVLSYEIPVIENIDAKILAAIEAGGGLNMWEWHTCETMHCRAGWAVHLAGDAGYALEAKVGTKIAAVLIYRASRPGQDAPDFSESYDFAMADIRKCAAQQSA